MRSSLLLLRGLVLILLGRSAAQAALGESSWITSTPTANALVLVQNGRAAPLLVDAADWPGVNRAAGDLQADIERITGVRPVLKQASSSPQAIAIVIGTVGHSPLLDGLIRRGKLDATAIAGKWESFLHEVIANPLPGIDRALVIAGSDKRGTIYGIYEASEQAGVSPWYWWADVPVHKSTSLFVQPGRHVIAEPVVKYRGIFLNDEAPALSGWAREKFGTLNSAFYRHVFELILRMRGNFLWPAMWGNAFNEDDPENPRLADDYGIVMSTSHHEPMLRAQQEWRRHGQGEWDYAKNAEALRNFWREGVRRNKAYESIVTLAMRGDGDTAMSADTNTVLLERIVTDQRKILAEEVNPDLATIPQVWALYKEVQTYYEKGMRVPDDVTLLWCDDNWGNIRRLPTPAERNRSGGAGIYYHFDYVGGPRNYKWLNTIALTKIWEQMNLAWKTDATRIWIVNVGDLKPLEFPIEYFLKLAWNPAEWPYERIEEYSRLWAAREFGVAHATEVAALINAYTKLNARRKPEMLAPDTLSLVNYRESDRVLAEWRDLVTRAERLNAQLPAEARDAFFQLVLYPVKASAVVQELYIAAGLNRLYARQGRAATNTEAARVRALFAEDGKLVDAYHALGHGRWNHMMDQINLGYTYWQQPDLETMPAVAEVRPREDAAMGVALEGIDLPPGASGNRDQLPALDVYARGTRWVDVFNRGLRPFSYKATADQSWVTLTPAEGLVKENARLELGVDWKAVPTGDSTALITIVSSNGERSTVRLPVSKPAVFDAIHGFVVSDHHIAIEAPHFQRAVAGPSIEWKTLVNFGRTLGGITPFPFNAPTQKPGGNSSHLEYDVYLFSAGEVEVDLHCAPSLDFQSGDGLQLAVSFDSGPPQVIKLDTWATLRTWERAVGDGVRHVTSRHRFDQPGHHVFKFWMVTPGVVLERIVIDTSPDHPGVRSSYLGPPESVRLP